MGALRRVNGFTLKLLAIVCMTIDHTAVVFSCGDLYWPMRYIGRIAFPIYCFLLVEGYFHTHSVGRYLRRLLIAFVFSDIPFDLALAWRWPSWYYQNVMLTLAIGLGAIWLIDHSGEAAARVTRSAALQKLLAIVISLAAALACYELAELLYTDYGGGGVVLILCFYLFRKHPPLLIVSVLATLYLAFGRVELPGMIAFLPIFLYNGQRGPTPGGKWGQWFFYAYYPLHLGILVLLSMALNGPEFYTFGF